MNWLTMDCYEIEVRRLGQKRRLESLDTCPEIPKHILDERHRTDRCSAEQCVDRRC